MTEGTTVELELKQYLDDLQSNINKHFDTKLSGLETKISGHIDSNHEAHGELKDRVKRVETDIDGVYTREQDMLKRFDQISSTLNSAAIKFERAAEAIDNVKEAVAGTKRSINQLYDENKKDRENFQENINRINEEHERQISAMSNRIDKTLDDHRRILTDLQERQGKDEQAMKIATDAITDQEKRIKKLEQIMSENAGSNKGKAAQWLAIAGALELLLMIAGLIIAFSSGG